MSADLIVTNAKVVTVDPTFSIADAVAITGERISAVGRVDDVGALAGDTTRTIDAAGRTVIPGLIDGHAHMDREGLKSVFPSLSGCGSIADIQERIRALANDAEPGEWIVTMPIGEPPYYWDVPQNLRENRLPTRWELDEAAPDNPVYIRPIWGFWRHTQPLDSVANSMALDLAGIGRGFNSQTQSVEFETDAASGEPNGIIHEWTYMPIAELAYFAMAPRFSQDDRVRGLKDAMRIYNSTGTTSVYEEHGAAQELIRAYQAVSAAGEATVRANLVYSPAWGALEGVDYARALDSWSGWLGGRGLGDNWVRVAGLFTEEGLSIDSVLRANTSPYTGWSGFNYDCGVPRERMQELMLSAARNEIRVNTIAMNLFDMYDEVDGMEAIAGQRWVLGHLNLVTEEQARRIAELGIVMTTHTNRYIYKQSHNTLKEVGEARLDDIVPIKRLLEAGVHVSLATDNVPTTLFYPIWQAVTRHNMYEDRPIGLDQALTREEALRCATIEGAWLTFEEDEKGSIEEGKLADIVILSDDPLTCAADDLKDIVAETTIVGGKVVYERENA